jgi:hypothetical protein
MIELLAWFLSFFPAPDMTGPVAVHAAYVIHTQQVDTPSKKCCGVCKGGFIIHGDGHKTPCPCPPDCECKAVKHQSVIVHQTCPDGTCAPKK